MRRPVPPAEAPKVDLEKMPPSVRKLVVKIAKKLMGGFTGEFTVKVDANGGIPWSRWTHTETGDALSEPDD